MDDRQELPPLMGFEEEQYVPGHDGPHPGTRMGTCAFYTAIINGKRVFVWAFGARLNWDGPCYFFSRYPPVPRQDVSALQFRFRRELDERYNEASVGRRMGGISDPFVLQFTLAHLATLEGN